MMMCCQFDWWGEVLLENPDIIDDGPCGVKSSVIRYVAPPKVKEFGGDRI